MSAGIDIPMRCSARIRTTISFNPGVAKRNQEENRLAYISTFVLVALGRERGERQDGAGTDAAAGSQLAIAPQLMMIAFTSQVEVDGSSVCIYCKFSAELHLHRGFGSKLVARNCPRNCGNAVCHLEEMVGTRRLELLTSTVSILRYHT
jgi:hypothetical protein